MPIRAPLPAADQQRLHAAAQAMEGLLVKQMVVASKAFTGGEGAGNAVRADMFADALSDALVKGGGLGLARQIEQSVTGERPQLPSPSPSPRPLPVPTASAPLSHPASGGLAAVTSGFGQRQDPFDGHLTRHAGVDLAGQEGAPIQAAAGGVVRRAGPIGGYGQAVEIDHGHGVTTLYAHASELLVREGEQVSAGQPVARVGHSGRATGPHLHFEVRQDGKPVDPRGVLDNAAHRPDLALPLLRSPPGAAAGAASASPGPSPDDATSPRAAVALKIYRARAEEADESGS